jgi:hypothetical protein
MSERTFILVGGPDCGKTNYIARLVAKALDIRSAALTRAGNPLLCGGQGVSWCARRSGPPPTRLCGHDVAISAARDLLVRARCLQLDHGCWQSGAQRLNSELR